MAESRYWNGDWIEARGMERGVVFADRDGAD